jgi:hypothetical protein
VDNSRGKMSLTNVSIDIGMPISKDIQRFGWRDAWLWAQGEVALDLVRGWHLGDVHRDLATPWKGQGAQMLWWFPRIMIVTTHKGANLLKWTSPLCQLAFWRTDSHVERWFLLGLHQILLAEVDPSRLYVTGLSLGASGSWHLAFDMVPGSRSKRLLSQQCVEFARHVCNWMIRLYIYTYLYTIYFRIIGNNLFDRHARIPINNYHVGAVHSL